ncbi:MAG: thermonuclease family protein [Methylovulum miyakonense]|uniref:thermonuclease family protein n=1 Tax=Methylovulum miyakonense TaxID=645578 RepID=UPI003BB4DC82
MKKTLLLLLLVASVAVSATEWEGTVVGVSDGDTVTVLDGQRRQVKVRLVEIDAPEKNQAFGTQSKSSLSGICFGKAVMVDDRGADKYKRTLGRIRCGGVDANAEQVRRGMAWAYRQYLTDPSIARMEEAAKASRLGLWSDANPIPPWEFRHGKKPAKSKIQPVAGKVSGSGGLTCGGKTLCGQMDSCEEARHYLNECGLTRLDRDHDGVPCESICK